MFDPSLSLDELSNPALGLAPDVLDEIARMRGSDRRFNQVMGLPSSALPPAANQARDHLIANSPGGESVAAAQMLPQAARSEDMQIAAQTGVPVSDVQRIEAETPLRTGGTPAAAQPEQRLAPADFAPRPGMGAPRPGGFGGGELAGLAREARGADSAFKTAQGEAAKKNQDALGERQRILGESALLGEQKAAEVGAYQRRQAQDMRALQQEQMAEQMREQEALKSQAEKAKRVASDYYRDEDGSVRVGEVAIASLAVALGAMGSAFTGGPNAALQIVNDNINRDIDAERGLLDDMEKQFADKGAAREAARAAKIEEHQQALAGLMNEYTAPEQRLKFEEMSAALEQEKAVALAQSAQLEHAATYQGLGFRQQNAGLRAQAAAASAKAGSGGVPGLEGQGISKEAEKEAAEIKGSVDGFRAKLALLAQINDESGTSLSPAARSRGESAIAAAIIDYNKLKKLGALDKGTIKMGERILGGNPADAFGVGGRRDLYKQVGEMIENDAGTRLKALGFTESSSRRVAETAR